MLKCKPYWFLNATWPNIMTRENQWWVGWHFRVCVDLGIYLMQTLCVETVVWIWQDKIHKAHFKTNLLHLNNDIHCIIFNKMTQNPWNWIHCKYFYGLSQSQYEKDIDNAADMNHLQTDSELTLWLIINIIYKTDIMFSKKVGCCNELVRIDLEVMVQSDGNILI